MKHTHGLRPTKKNTPAPHENGAFDTSDHPFHHETRRHWRHTAIFAGLIQPAGYYTFITARTAPNSGDDSRCRIAAHIQEKTELSEAEKNSSCVERETKRRKKSQERVPEGREERSQAIHIHLPAS